MTIETVTLQREDFDCILRDANKWRMLMLELQSELKDGMPIDATLAHIIKTRAESIDRDR